MTFDLELYAVVTRLRTNLKKYVYFPGLRINVHLGRENAAPSWPDKFEPAPGCGDYCEQSNLV